MRASLSVRERAVLAAAALAMACVLTDRAIALRTRYVEALDQRIAHARMELLLGQKLLMTRGAIAQAELELGLMSNRSEELSDVSAFLSKLDQEARASGITVLSMRPALGGDMRAAMSLTGDWVSLLKFLSALQSKPRFLDILELRIEHKAARPGELHVECVFGRLAGQPTQPDRRSSGKTL